MWGKPILNKEMDEDDCRLVISFILQYQFILKAMIILYKFEKDTDRKYDMIYDIFLRKKHDNEIVSLRNIIDIFVIPNQKNMWLALSMKIILSSNIVDTEFTEGLRRNFYWYITQSSSIRKVAGYKLMSETIERIYSETMSYQKKTFSIEFCPVKNTQIQGLAFTKPREIEGKVTKTHKAMGYKKAGTSVEDNSENLSNILSNSRRERVGSEFSFENINSSISGEESNKGSPPKEKQSTISILKNKIGI